MVQVRPVPRDASPLATGLGGAGAAVRGFQESAAFDEQRKIRAQQLELDQAEFLRRMEALKLAERSHDLDVMEWLGKQQEAKRERDEESQQRRQAGDLFSSLRVMDEQPQDAGLAHGEAGPPAPQTYGPESWARQQEAVGAAVRSGALTPKEGADTLKIVATQQQAALRRVAAGQMRTKLVNEIASGYWNPANALGLELDVDGDGKPDPVSETPQLLLAMLDDPKVTPETVEALHFRVTQAIDAEKARIETREIEAAKAEALMRDPNRRMTPEAKRLAMGRVGAWRRDEYPQTAQGLRDFEQDMEQAMAGNVPMMLKSGVKVYVPEAQAREAELDIAADPAFERMKAEMDMLAKFIGEFRPPSDITNPTEINALWKQYLLRAREAKTALGIGAQPQGREIPHMAIKDPAAPRGTQSSNPSANGGVVTKPAPLTERIRPAGSEPSTTSKTPVQDALGGRTLDELTDEEAAEIIRKLRGGG